jgi:hypothetical protein
MSEGVHEVGSSLFDKNATPEQAAANDAKVEEILNAPIPARKHPDHNSVVKRKGSVMKHIPVDHPLFAKAMEHAKDHFNMHKRAILNDNAPDSLVLAGLESKDGELRDRALGVANKRGLSTGGVKHSSETRVSRGSTSGSGASSAPREPDHIAAIHASHAAGYLSDEDRDEMIAMHHANQKQKENEGKKAHYDSLLASGTITPEMHKKKLAELGMSQEGESEKKNEVETAPKKVANPQKKATAPTSSSSKVEAVSISPESIKDYKGSHNKVTKITKNGKTVGHVATTNGGFHEIHDKDGNAVKHSASTHAEAVAQAIKHFSE